MFWLLHMFCSLNLLPSSGLSMLSAACRPWVCVKFTVTQCWGRYMICMSPLVIGRCVCLYCWFSVS